MPEEPLDADIVCQKDVAAGSVLARCASQIYSEVATRTAKRPMGTRPPPRIHVQRLRRDNLVPIPAGEVQRACKFTQLQNYFPRVSRTH
jgi:hypothetical protein